MNDKLISQTVQSGMPGRCDERHPQGELSTTSNNLNLSSNISYSAGRFNVGIFVNSLEPKGSSQANFQATILSGLQKLCLDRYHFTILSYEIPTDYHDDENFTFLKIKPGRPVLSKRQKISSSIRRFVKAFCGFLGIGSSGIIRHFQVPSRPEPFVYSQLRKHNVRLIWNLNQHELPTFLPYIRTIWDVNHRIHSMYPEFSYSRFKFEGLDWNISNSLAKASYIITGTDVGKKELESIYGVYSGKVRVVPFPTPSFALSQDMSAKVGVGQRTKPYLFYPARFWPHKNHVVIVAALKVLRDKWGIDFDVIFTGADEGNLKHVLEFAEKNGVRDSIHYAGLVSIDELVRLYSEAFALVFAAAVGPDNLPPLEAMSLNCPVITSDLPGAREQFGDAAMYFKPHDECELAERIKELMENRDLKEEKLKLGRKRAQSWTAGDYVDEVLKIIDEFQLISRSWERNDSTFT